MNHEPIKPVSMKDDPKDALDQDIDLVLASIAAEEPRRVDAASVRRALRTRRAVPPPVWFAAAAVLILAIGVVVSRRAPAGKAPELIARSGGAPVVPEARVTPTKGPGPAAPTSRRSQARPPRPRAETVAEPPYEGLPRLVVAAIDVPEPLSTGPLSGEAIVIPQIEITPLIVPSLPNEHEPRQ